MKIYFGYHDDLGNSYREINGKFISQDKVEEIFKEFLELVYGREKEITNGTSCDKRESVKD